MITQPQMEQTCYTTREERVWLVTDRRGREKAGEQGWQVPVRVSVPSIWPSFTLLRRVASAARCLSLPLLNFLFSSLPPTKKKKLKCCFLLPRNKCLLLARPTLQASWCGEFGKGVSFGSNTSCCVSSRGGQSAIHREI